MRILKPEVDFLYRVTLQDSNRKFNPFTPVPVDLCFTFDVINFDQIKLVSCVLKFCRRKEPSNDTQIRVIGLVELKISTKVLRNLSEKNQSKIASDYSWLLHGKICPTR